MFFDRKPIINLPFLLLILKNRTEGERKEENMTSINIGSA
jgi:hypothetical protein